MTATPFHRRSGLTHAGFTALGVSARTGKRPRLGGVARCVSPETSPQQPGAAGSGRTRSAAHTHLPSRDGFMFHGTVVRGRPRGNHRPWTCIRAGGGRTRSSGGHLDTTSKPGHRQAPGVGVVARKKLEAGTPFPSNVERASNASKT